MTLRLPAAMIGEIIAHAYQDLPNECCGLIAAKDGVAQKLYRTRNAEASPFRYLIHPLDFRNADEEIDAQGWEVAVIYHSHVASRAYPSPTDVRMAKWPGTDLDMFPNAHYVLVSLKARTAPLVRAFRIINGKVRRDRLEELLP